jgi:hypothetical protein
VNRIRLVGLGQQVQSVVVVVAVVDVVVVAVVDVVVVAVVDVVVVAVVAVVDVVVVSVVAVVDVVVVTVVGVVVVVGTGGQTHPARQSSSAPPGDPDGHVALPGGSHCSPASTTPFPHTGPPCVVDVVLVVVTVVELVVLAVVPVVDVVVVAVVAVVEVVVVDEDVVLGPGHTQPSRQSSNAPPGDPDGHVALPGGSHCSPGSTTPFPQTGPWMVVVVVDGGVVVDVVEGGTRVVVVDDGKQPFGPHASQQLGCSVTQAVPPRKGLHASALGRSAQRDTPCALVRQQVTAPLRPHVDFDSHLMTLSKHSLRSLPAFTAALMKRKTHIRYLPWLSTPAQSHFSSARVRTSFICTWSVGTLPQIGASSPTFAPPLLVPPPPGVSAWTGDGTVSSRTARAANPRTTALIEASGRRAPTRGRRPVSVRGRTVTRCAG